MNITGFEKIVARITGKATVEKYAKNFEAIFSKIGGKMRREEFEEAMRDYFHLDSSDLDLPADLTGLSR